MIVVRKEDELSSPETRGHARFGWQLPQQLLFIWQQHESEVIHAGHQAVRKAQNWYWYTLMLLKIQPRRHQTVPGCTARQRGNKTQRRGDAGRQLFEVPITPHPIGANQNNAWHRPMGLSRGPRVSTTGPERWSCGASFRAWSCAWCVRAEGRCEGRTHLHPMVVAVCHDDVARRVHCHASRELDLSGAGTTGAECMLGISNGRVVTRTLRR